ncbi:hypothetical protein TrLO_g9083 [Triparma laevis f. longispina]|uniref:Uncharacterized protein n=1 Tax=Triparma laevis f. longispina TaxID=1714387 RepID=A0A9W7ANG4_9STRA|nr:hypothetical protein TrLO_g9083 [Triparma laevis f. longispina]
MASIDSMESEEFDAFSSAFLQRISPDSNRKDRYRRDDRRAKLGLTPKDVELGDVDLEAKKRIENRRGSMAGSLDPDQARANIENLHVALIKVLGWAGADKDNIEELAEQFDSVVTNSFDLVEAVSAWFDKSVPTQGMTEEQKQGFKLFLISVARRNRLAKKMARIGVAWKLLLTLSMGYIDVVTDLLVSKSYYDAKDFSTAYATAGFAILAIVIQALLTFIVYGKKSWIERFGRTLAALLGLAPLMEGASVWTGKKDNDLMLSGPMMYASMKAGEIAFESIPESIIQIGGLLKHQNYGDIKTIQIIGVVSSIVSGAFIMTDGNFGFILSKYLASPGDPFYGWISKVGGWEKRRQIMGMFLFIACYFSQFVFAMSLFGQAFGSRAPVFVLLGVEFCAVCVYMGWKGELFGYALVSKPSTFNNTIVPFIMWAFWYLLVSAVPMLIAAAPMELGPQVFAGTMVWRLLTNGGIVYVALGELQEKEHFLSLTTGMAGFGLSFVLAAIGLAMFFRNCDPLFDRSLLWKAKSGKQMVRECWRDERIWRKARKTKNDERWGLVAYTHPAYLEFDDVVTPWICEDLVEKYEEEGVERPKWMNSKNNGKFIKRIAEIYIWKGSDGEKVDVALAKLFKRSGADLEKGEDGLSLTFINSKKSRGRIEGIKVQPE